MKKYLLLFLITIATMPLVLNAQMTATFGTGTSATGIGGSAGAPMSYGAAYSWTQQIYRAAELTAANVPAGAVILSIEFYNATGATLMSDIRTYMGHCTKDYFSGTSDWVPYNTLSLVDSGDWNASDGWFSIDLDAPFVWNGTSNFVVGVSFRGAHSDYQTNNPNCGYQYTTQSGSAHIRRFSTTLGSEDPTSSGIANSVSTNRPNLRITYIVSGCASLTPKVANIGLYTADLNWMNFQQAVQSWDLKYGVTGTFDTLSGGTTVTNITDTFYTLTGLAPSVTYSVYLKPYCSSETSTWSLPRTFTMPEACPSPTNVSVSDVSFYNAVLTWTADSSASEWQICLNDDTNNIYIANTTFYTLNGLIPGTEYTVKVRANCGENGVSNWSLVNFTTLECVAPYGLSTSLTISGTATISWQGFSNTYNLRYRPAGNSEWVTVIGVAATTYTINGLIAGDYELEVAAACDSASWIQTTFSIMEILSTANWYGYVCYTKNGEVWDDHFVSFSMLNPTIVTSATGALQTSDGDSYTLAATYANGYVWCITKDGNLSRAILDNNTKTISEFETIITGFENTYSNSMSYNPIDGRIYYIMYNEHKLKSFHPSNPENVTEIGTYNVNALTLAIDSAGKAYCIEISTGNLYKLNLDNAYSTLIGNTGKNVIYAQSMAFDLETNELFWAQYDQNGFGLYKVDPSTAVTFYIGQIGGGDKVELTGLFKGDNAVISCPNPVGLAVSEITSHSAVLNWTETGTASSWQICLNGDTTNLVTANSNPFMLTGLVDETIYMAKVRAYCDSVDQSAWSDIVTFETTEKLVIGSGTAVEAQLPSHTYYNYSLTQQIYTVEELGDAAAIMSIDFFSTATERTRNMDIYMVSTDKVVFESNTDWISVTENDKVFSGQVTFIPDVWTTIVLDIPFYYDGLNNVAIVVDDNTGSYLSGSDFRVFSANSVQSIYYYSDYNNYNPMENLAAATNCTTLKNQIRLLKGDCFAKFSVFTNNSALGTCTGSGCYSIGDTVSIQAVPKPHVRFLRWSDNDTTNPRVVIAESDSTFTALFDLFLPELHVTSISHSDFIGGESATVTWTVKNEGTAQTPNGVVWYDRVWLSLEPRVGAGESGTIFLGEFPNVSALAPGEFYTQTKTFDIPLTISGPYYLFVITDAYDANTIYWENGEIPDPYNPPVYISALSGNYYGSHYGNKVLERSEYGHNSGYHDNFFYELLEITIAPVPDLIVSSISPTIQNFFSGTSVDFAYQVRNDGDYDTRVSYWTDVVFVSNSPVFDDNARVIKTIPHYGLLLPDSSYQVVTLVSVPFDMHGTAWFYVYTDYYDQVYEHVGRYNNVTRSDSVNIILTPPADLTPRNVIADQTVSTGSSFHFSYEILNQGAGAPNNSTWLDRCYLSTNADSLENVIQIASDLHYNGLASGEYYSISHNVSLPSNISEGTYYLFVRTDVQNNVFEFDMENNNLLHSDHPILVVKPDLQISSMNVADTLHAGAEEGISYYVANTGEGAVVNQYVKDIVYLSPYQNGANADQIATLSHNLWLNAHDSIQKMKNVTIPGNLQEGVYYLFVGTNTTNSLNESNFNNNLSLLKQVYIHYLPLPDLVITNVEMPDTMTAGDAVVLSIYLHNQGEVAVNIGNLSWQLNVSVAGQNNSCVVGNGSSGVQVLEAGATVFIQKSVHIPPMSAHGSASFELTVNHTYSITESSYSNNGYMFTREVHPYPFDLAVTDFVSPLQTISGDYVSVGWTVKNQGAVTSISSWWYDDIYLSSDSLFDAGDIQIGTYTRTQTLNAGDSYTANVNCQIPLATEGNYYLLVVSDATNATLDYQRTNNVRGGLFSVIPSSLPDLQMDTLETLSGLISGNTYKIHYTVANRGEHSTHGNRWTDAFYINNQQTLQGAQNLGSKIHYGQLDTNAYYMDSISVVVPDTWAGNLYLMGYTDATNQIVEKNGESKNLFVLPVSVSRPLPCDLTVASPDFPQNVNVGENVHISWALQNVGQNVAQGSIKDAVYLSMDSIWSSDDVMLGSVTHSVSLSANGQIQRSVTMPLQGVSVGDYYVVVKTNILNALNENTYTNNKAVSLMTMHVDYPSLYIDQEEQVQLNSGQSVYYKLEVGPEYEHQTLSCKLTASTPNVSNGLYIAYSSAPSASNFDWSATMPYVQEQEILIPSLNQGTYYIMATGQMANNAVQPVTLLATIVDFEIISVTANSGANTGSVTTQIIGAKFDTVMDFRLANSNGYLPAEKVFFHNSTESYATFNLRDQETGVYDMEAELPGGIITVKGQAFVVEQGVPAELLSNIIAPASVRNGNTFTVTIEYGNNGSTDLNISGFLLVSTNGFPIAFSSDSLANNATELTFETGEPNGNPDVIRPGHFATKTIFVKATQVGNINLKLYPIRRQY